MTGHVEPFGELHQAHCLAVALGLGHAEVVADAALGVGALLVADDHDGTAAKPPKPADDRLVLGEIAVAGHGREVLDQRVDEVEAMRALGMTRHLGLLPGRRAWRRCRRGLLRAFCSSFLISSAMETGRSSPSSARSSATLLSSSAMGFSKSRYVRMVAGRSNALLAAV